MSDLDGLKWIIGIFVTFGVTLIGSFQHLSGKIAKLHTRIDEVKDNYVRRDDFNTHIERIERSNTRIEKSIERLDEKLDRLLISKVPKE